METRKVAILVCAVLATALLPILMITAPVPSGANGSNQTYLYSVNGKAFYINMVATNQSSWEKGLMNATITNTTMMVFVFPSLGIYPFWMWNTRSNLDMMWLNVSGGSGKVVYLVTNATSCVGETERWCTDRTYTPTAPANYVIEAKAGFAQRNDIGVGTEVELSRTR